MLRMKGVPPTHPTLTLLQDASKALRGVENPKGTQRKCDTNLTTLCDVSHSTQARGTCNYLSFSLRTFEVFDRGLMEYNLM